MTTLHSKVRALATVALFWALYLGILYIASIPKGMAPSELRDLTWGLVSSAALLGLTWFLLKREGRLPQEVGIEATPRRGVELGVGLVIGLAIYALTMVVVHFVAEPLSLEPTENGSLFFTLLAVATYLALAVMEELGFRGYPLRTLVPAIGFWPAQIVVAVAFALSHRLFGWSWETIGYGVLPNAFLFGLAATTSRGLAFPIGLHAALNLAAWSVNAKDLPGIWNLVIPNIIGSQVGPVAVNASLAITLGAAALCWWVGRRATAPGSEPPPASDIPALPTSST